MGECSSDHGGGKVRRELVLPELKADPSEGVVG